MVELADTQVLGICAYAYGFESHYPHHYSNVCSPWRNRVIVYAVPPKISEITKKYFGRQVRFNILDSLSRHCITGRNKPCNFF